MEINKARPEDIDAILEMEKMCFTYDAWTPKMLEEEISNSNVFARSNVVRNSAGEAVAYCISRTVMDEMQILKLAVHPLHRRKGLAGMLLRDSMRHLGRGLVTLEVAVDNTDAISLYSKMGFEKTTVRENYYRGGRLRDGTDAFVMTMQAGRGK